MTDLEKATYLNRHIGCYIPYYHIAYGDSTAQVVSVSANDRTFKYIAGDIHDIRTMSFDDVVEFEFRSNGIPPSLNR